MDKSRQVIRRAGDSLLTNRRPKRCHLCRKNFAPDKYSEHFEACYRVQNKKIEDSRTPISHKSTFKKNYKQSSQAQPTGPSLSKSNHPRSGRPDTANRFRIKNTSNLGPVHPKPNSLAVAQQQEDFLPQNEAQYKAQKKVSSEKINIQERQEQLQKCEQNKIKESRDSRIEVQRKVQIQSQQRPILNQQNPEDIQLNSLRLNRQTQQFEGPFRNSPQRVQQQVTRPVLFVQDPQEEDISAVQPSLNIEAMIENSNSIIEFIRNTHIMGEDQTLSTMMAQLQQLNLIAEQILQLNQLGRALAIGNVFALRIHELQNAIINQIGIALMRGLNGRLGIELQILMSRQPQLKVGFTFEEIDRIFQQKLNCKQQECAICLQEMGRSTLVMELQCNHIFHPTCVREWLISSSKCPLCRQVQVDRSQ